jgi:hypothetical protein
MGTAFFFVTLRNRSYLRAPAHAGPIPGVPEIAISY